MLNGFLRMRRGFFHLNISIFSLEKDEGNPFIQPVQLPSAFPFGRSKLHQPDIYTFANLIKLALLKRRTIRQIVMRTKSSSQYCLRSFSYFFIELLYTFAYTADCNKMVDQTHDVMCISLKFPKGFHHIKHLLQLALKSFFYINGIEIPIQTIGDLQTF